MGVGRDSADAAASELMWSISRPARSVVTISSTFLARAGSSAAMPLSSFPATGSSHRLMISAACVSPRVSRSVTARSVGQSLMIFAASRAGIPCSGVWRSVARTGWVSAVRRGCSLRGGSWASSGRDSGPTTARCAHSACSAWPACLAWPWLRGPRRLPVRPGGLGAAGDPPQDGGDRGGVRPLLRVLAQHREHEGGDLAPGSRLGQVLAEDGGDRRGQGLGPEGRPALKGVVERHAERPQVRRRPRADGR